MECRLGWSDDFLTENLTKTFLLGDYKKHRENILLDMERARLPETQEDAARYKRAHEVCDPIIEQVKEISKQIRSLPELEAMNKARNTYYSCTRHEIHTSRNEHWDAFQKASIAYEEASAPLAKQISQLHNQKTYRENAYYLTSFGRPRPQRAAAAGAGAGAGEESRTRSAWTFVMKCPVDDCQGFVGMNWVCGLCETLVCKECRDPICKKSEQEERKSEHQCDPEKMQSAKAIQKEAKPCPKCAAMISKINGCDQMWCTQCHVAFSWRTGQIEERVHNPHYYEWMRRNGGLAPVPQHQQQMNVECLAPNDILNHIIMGGGGFGRDHQILNWVRQIRHFSYVLREEQRQQRDDGRENRLHTLRVQRLVNEIDDDAWKIALQRIEKAFQKRQRVIQVLETYVQAGVDILRGILLEAADKEAICNQLDELKTYCKNQFSSIQKRYNNIVPNLDEVNVYF